MSFDISYLELRNRFVYHPPRHEDTKAAHEKVRSLAWEFAKDVGGLIPKGREASIALTKIEEAMFWANAAIARNQEEEI